MSDESKLLCEDEDIVNSAIESREVVDLRTTTDESKLYGDIVTTGEVVQPRTTSVIVLNENHRAHIKASFSNAEEEDNDEEMEEPILIDLPHDSSSDKDQRLKVEAVYTYVPITGDKKMSTSSVIIQPGQIPIPIKLVETSCKAPPADCPQWAARLSDCEKIGTSYRGYVENDIELDLLLTFHKQETGSFWGTRQSPSAERSSKRLMWRSQYVPYDGVPFVNMGSRAVTMECQFGPRRKSKSWKSGSSKHFKTSCPARIHIKKVKKFIQYKAGNANDKKEHDKIFQSIKEVGVDQAQGVERCYVQLPTIQAHDYHEPITSENVLQPMLELQRQETPPEERMNPKVAKKIQDLMSEGISNDFQIRSKLRQYVLQDLFKAEKSPDRHDPRYFPTINNIQNYKHEINKAVEKGELILEHKVGIIGKKIEDEDDELTSWIEPAGKVEDDAHSSEGLTESSANTLLSQINTTKTTKSNIVTCTEVSDSDTTNSQSSSLLPMMESENNQSNSLLQDSGAESLLSEMQNNQSVIESADDNDRSSPIK
ncbi:calcium-responsive transcription factor-like isoform X2 [Anneissia japonica]|nr:calcium-responsive transcription factor-like isoform X2 [Anneissia japonica]XP_033102035.1 calcium-responsive transcription factor-like isoform X2 [Anneissia japonica]